MRIRLGVKPVPYEIKEQTPETEPPMRVFCDFARVHDILDEFQRTAVVLRLISWTLDRPIPATADEVDDLPQDIYVPLTVAASDVKFGDDEDEFDDEDDDDDEDEDLDELTMRTRGTPWT